MRWFDHWFARKWRWAWENRDELEKVVASPRTNSTNSGRLVAAGDEAWEDSLRISIKRMIGGSVVSFRIYDHRTDRSDSRHYIITDDEDFNTELGKIITMESMRQT